MDVPNQTVLIELIIVVKSSLPPTTSWSPSLSPSTHYTHHTHTHTDAIDFDLLIDTLRKLKEGRSVEVPVYDFNTHARASYTVSSNKVCVSCHCHCHTQCM